MERPQGVPEEVQQQEHVFSEKEIKDYKDGCEEVGLKLSYAVERMVNEGKKPTILIPSRGAIPIFLNAINSLREGHDSGPLGNPSRMNFYPSKIFQYLAPDLASSEAPKEDETTVDIVLYPFTADVSLFFDPDSSQTKVKNSASVNVERVNSDAEDLAKGLRTSCAKSIDSLLYGDGSSLDLAWHFFLLSKVNPNVFKTFGSSPEEYADSLKSVSSDPNREIILIDTVLSGRAVTNISEAFNELGHPVTPIFAVDNKEGRLQKRYAERIRRAVNPKYIDNVEEQYTRFPLITEDEGPAFLGVSALNISNFNTRKYFLDTALPLGFLPQSCLWLVPPRDEAVLDYQDVFLAFMNLCQTGDYGEDFPDIIDLQMGYYLGKEGSRLSEFGNDVLKGARVKNNVKTSSGIISMYMDPRDAEKWVGEFLEKVKDKNG